MTPDQLMEHFDTICDAPNAVARLRQFILDLAVRGKLVEQDPADEPAVELLKRIGKATYRSSNLNRANLAENTGDFLIPDSWKWARLGDIVVSRDAERIPVSREDRSLRARIYDYYGASGVIDKIDSYLFDKPLLLIGEDGANLINRTTPIAFMARGKYWVNNHAHVLDGISEQFLQYLALYINAIDLKQFVTGTAQPKMNQAKMHGIPIALPPLAEQHRIVVKVDELMALCDRLEAAQAEREARRDALNAASLHRLSEPADDAPTFRKHVSFHIDNLDRVATRPEQVKALRQAILNLAVRGKLVDNVGYELPKAKLRDIGRLQNGYAFKSEWFQKSGVRLLRNANVSHGVINWRDTVHIENERVFEFERFQLHENDIVLSLDRPFITTGAKVARIRQCDMPCLLLQRVGRLVFDSSRLLSDYLYMWLNSPDFESQVNPGRSLGVPHISSKDVESTKLSLPPLAEQHRIVAKVDELMKVCDALEAQLASARDSRGRLLESVLHAALAGGVV